MLPLLMLLLLLLLHLLLLLLQIPHRLHVVILLRKAGVVGLRKHNTQTGVHALLRQHQRRHGQHGHHGRRVHWVSGRCGRQPEALQRNERLWD